MISAPTSSLATLSSLVVMIASGCVIDDIDPTGRRCPCATGYVCDAASDRCVEEVSADAGDVVPDADADVAEDADALVDAYVPVDAPPPRPFCETVPEAIFCEDFESGDLTRWDTVEPTAGGEFITDPSAAHSGNHGLRISTLGGVGVMRISVPIDSVEARLYFRAWFRVSADTAGTLSIFELFAGSAGSVSAQLLPSAGAFRVRVASAGTEGSSDESGRRWTVGAWTCVRGVVVRDDRGEVTILDAPAPQRASLVGHDTDWGTPYDTFKITLEGSDAGSQIDLDDIVWTRSELPCP